MEEKRAKTSGLPSSGVIKPKPLVELNHLMLPLAITKETSPSVLHAGNACRRPEGDRQRRTASMILGPLRGSAYQDGAMRGSAAPFFSDRRIEAPRFQHRLPQRGQGREVAFILAGCSASRLRIRASSWSGRSRSRLYSAFRAGGRSLRLSEVLCGRGGGGEGPAIAAAVWS